MNTINPASFDAESFNVEELRRQLKTQVFGRGDKLHYLPAVDSTNVRAMELAFGGSEEGTVVLTDTQFAGKGRRGRRWLDTPGNDALLSVVLHPLFPPHRLVMPASLAVVNAISEVCNISATIKWPNDTLIGGRKVSGILIETSRTPSGQLIAVLGIGINVNGSIQKLLEEPYVQAPLMAASTTLKAECGQYVSREALIAHLLQQMETDYFALQEEVSTGSQDASNSILERWRDRLSTLGQTIEVQQGDAVVSGVAVDVNKNGELLLRRPSGETVTIMWGDIVRG